MLWFFAMIQCINNYCMIKYRLNFLNMLSEKSLLILNMIWGQILQEDQMYLQTHITLERQIRIRWWWQTRNVYVAMHLAAGTELIEFYHTTVSIIFIYILITTIVNILTDQLGAGGEYSDAFNYHCLCTQNPYWRRNKTYCSAHPFMAKILFEDDDDDAACSSIPSRSSSVLLL